MIEALEPVDIIFFGAHPDDIELSCGGTIAKSVADGLRVGIIELTRGELGTRGTPKIRRREALNAMRILGARFREQLDFGDGNIRTGRDEELQIIEIVRTCKPKVVFTMWPDDRHPDHIRTGRIVTEASWYAGLRALEDRAAAASSAGHDLLPAELSRHAELRRRRDEDVEDEACAPSPRSSRSSTIRNRKSRRRSSPTRSSWR